ELRTEKVGVTVIDASGHRADRGPACRRVEGELLGQAEPGPAEAVDVHGTIPGEGRRLGLRNVLGSSGCLNATPGGGEEGRLVNGCDVLIDDAVEGDLDDAEAAVFEQADLERYRRRGRVRS